MSVRMSRSIAREMWLPGKEANDFWFFSFWEGMMIKKWGFFLKHVDFINFKDGLRTGDFSACILNQANLLNFWSFIAFLVTFSSTFRLLTRVKSLSRCGHYLLTTLLFYYKFSQIFKMKNNANFLMTKKSVQLKSKNFAHTDDPLQSRRGTKLKSGHKE